MARFSTAVFVTASVSSSDFLNHNEVLGNSAFDIVALKIVPSIVGGTSEAQVYERDTFLTADLLYSTNPFVATGFDPIQKDSGGVITEALRGFVAPYEDQDSTGEFHIKLINNDSQAKTYTITLIYEVVAATSVVNIDDLGDVTISGVASGEVLKWDGANWINNTLAEAGIAAASHVHSAADITTGLLAIARGGTNGATAGAGFDNLSPLTTLGDVIFRDASNNVRLTGNITTTKQFLSQTGDGAVSAAPVWSALVNADLPAAMEITTSLGIGGAVETSAGFELDSTTQAVLVSRMTTGERDALTDVNGFIIYNSSLAQMQGRINGAWVDMGQGGGTGDVLLTGTPVNNQIAVWTNGTTIEGDSNFTWTGSVLAATGDFILTGDLGLGGTPQTSAGLQLDSTTKAILVSRMTTTQRNALTDVDGFILYNSTDSQLQGRISGAWVDLGQGGGGGGNVSNTGTPLDNQLAIWTDATTVQGDAELSYDGNSFRCSGSGPHGFGTIPLSFIQFTFAGFFTSSGANNYTVGVLFNTDLTSAAGDIRADCARMGGAAGGSITTPGGGESLTIASLRIDEPNITVGGGDTVTIAASLFIMNAPDEGTNNYALIVDEGLSRFDDGMIIGGAVALANASVGVELSSTTLAVLLSRLTTSERDALTAVNGMIAYNSTLNQLHAYVNGAWIDIGGAGGGGGIDSNGTPVAGQVTRWFDVDTVEGDAGFTDDGVRVELRRPFLNLATFIGL